MLYLLYGNDFRKKRNMLERILSSLAKKRPDASVFKVSAEDITEDGINKVNDLLGSQALFGGSYAVVFEGVIPEHFEVIKDSLKEMGSSEHVFIFVEDGLRSPEMKAFGKAGAEMEEFSGKTAAKKPFNIFSLADALASKNKKDLWSLYRRALREGLSPEEIAGTLFWQIKTLILVYKEDTEGLKGFTISKAGKNLSKWSDVHLRSLLEELVAIYHKARRGGPPLSEGLELFLLRI